MSLLITGHRGFLGSHLARFFQHTFKNPDETDITDEKELRQLAEGKFKTILHLAGISNPRVCQASPTAAYRVNTAGALATAEILKQSGAQHFIFFSSGYIYKSQQGAIDEAAPIELDSPYARSKFLAEEGLKHLAGDGFKVTVLRLFNHTHSTQSSQFFLPSMHHQIVKTDGQVSAGNLALKRDLSSVQDLLTAIGCLLDQPNKQPVGFEVYNLGSGYSKKLDLLVETLANRLGKKVEILADPARIRQNEPLEIVADSGKFQETFGWRPTCIDESTLIDHFLQDLSDFQRP